MPNYASYTLEELKAEEELLRLQRVRIDKDTTQVHQLIAERERQKMTVKEGAAA